MRKVDKLIWIFINYWILDILEISRKYIKNWWVETINFFTSPHFRHKLYVVRINRSKNPCIKRTINLSQRTNGSTDLRYYLNVFWMADRLWVNSIRLGSRWELLIIYFDCFAPPSHNVHLVSIIRGDAQTPNAQNRSVWLNWSRLRRWRQRWCDFKSQFHSN